MTLRSLRLQVGTWSLAAIGAGAESAPPVLLLPGFTGSKEDFAPVLPQLADGGFQAIAIDLPGQFESPGPDDPALYTPDALAPVVHQVIDHLGGRVHLLGHSYGGFVARATVLADTAGRIASLVLMSSGPAAIGGPRRALLDHLEPMLGQVDIATLYDATLAARAAAPDYVAPEPAEAAFLRRRFLAGTPAMLRGMADAIRVEPDRVDELAARGLTIQVLCGEDDDAWAPQTQAEMAHLLDADYLVVESAAHSPAEENSAATAAALIAFWRAAT